MRQKLLFTLLLFGINGLLNAQDTIQIMQYNILNYGNFTNYCTSSNNSILDKNENFKIIFDYVKPDILTVNEMGGDPIFHDSLMNATLNVGGETAYKRATLTSASQGDWIVNMLYYNSRKLTLYKHEAIQTAIRPTDVYQLYINAIDLAETNDTVFITCIVTHLKAGSDSGDQNTRTIMVNSIMDYIHNNDMRHNYLLMGDFNVRSASETAYFNMVGSYHLYDPLEAPGDWNSNDVYRFLHTQSPRTEYNGCASNGGLDDRFDFILASGAIMDGSKGLTLDVDSYHVLGNDGLHFNTSILASPENSSAPADVVNALYYGSDHLPVLVQLTTEQSYLGLRETGAFTQVKFQNPVKQQLDLHIAFDKAMSFEVRIYDIMGRVQLQLPQSEKNLQHQLSIDLANLKSGIYFLHLKTENGQEKVHKFFKN